MMDYTTYPKLLESRFEALDSEAVVRPTIINPGSVWSKSYQESLLSSIKTKSLKESDQTEMKDAAFDLLDALTRSGALTVDDASLHVIIASTHCFDQSIMDSIVKNNINPIERVERSLLITSSAITGESIENLVNVSQLQRITANSPQLLTNQPNNSYDNNNDNYNDEAEA
eukprot:gene6301-8678_t